MVENIEDAVIATDNVPKAQLFDSKTAKVLRSPHYNYVYKKGPGTFARWGGTLEEDPAYSHLGPEIADIEISTVCNGVGNGPCKFCYKSNTGKGENMSLELFKKVFSKFPPVLTQIAFGIGDIDANPDLWNIMRHCRENGIVPNITINVADRDWETC